MPVEISDTSSHEDIIQAVDSIIEARAGDEKSDAAKIAEERDKPVGDTSAEIDSGSSDDTAVEGEDTGEDKIDWLDDDLKAELTAYGLDEKGVSDFTSREELERALRFFDKSALEAGRKAMAEGEGETPTRDEHGRFQKKEAEATDPTEGTYEIGLSKDIYDEDLVDELTRMRDHYETRLGALETKLAEQEAKELERTFDTYVDGLGFPEVFGKTGKENPNQLKIREDLLVDCLAHREGLKLFGRTIEFDQSLVLRAARVRHPEVFSKKELKDRTRKLMQQTPGVGGGATKSPEPQESIRDWARREYKAREHAG